MKIIEIDSLSKEFYLTKGLLETLIFPFQRKKKKTVLNQLSLSINKGELFCILGPNGAGKSTLIKILSNLLLPTTGKISVNGFDLLKESKKVRESIALISGDERSFFWRLSGLDNLKFFAELYGIPPANIPQEIRRVLDISKIDEPHKRFQEYSSGIKQRLAIARALLKEPKILFMDEPTKSLDPIISRTFRNFIKNELVKKHGITVLCATHQLVEAQMLADRLAILDQGKIKALGKLDDLREAAGTTNQTLEEVLLYYLNKD